MITIHTLSYNEELMITHMVNHYRKRFSNPRIIVHDNMSIDNTVDISKSLGLEVIYYNTNNTIDDAKYLDIKNNSWKNDGTDWSLICDMDEFLDITEDQLRYEDSFGTTIIRSEGYNMVNFKDDFDIDNIKYGERTLSYDKTYLFKRSEVQNINYSAGCHKCLPTGTIKYSKFVYKAYHYHFINMKYVIEKYSRNAKRLSVGNKLRREGIHYMASENDIITRYNTVRNNAIKIR